MNRILLPTCSRQKPCVLFTFSRHYQTSGISLPRSQHKNTQNERLDKALRVLDIIAPKTRIATSRQSHFRLVQLFLQTNSIEDNAQQLSNDFACSNALYGLPNVFDEMFESTVLNNNDLIRRVVRFDASDLSQAVSSCGSRRSLRDGVQYHCLAIRTGFIANVYVGSSLISLYGNCGNLKNAYQVFEEMPERNVVSWTAIIAGYAQEGRIDACLQLYTMMRNSTSKPNDFTFTTLLSACTGSGALGYGRSAHCQTIQMGFDTYIHISNALISMYCKSGIVEDAFCIFETMGDRDIISWNSMIAGCAQHGLVMQAIDLFEEMKMRGVKPDAFTFLGVLSLCRHAGLVNKGRRYFNSMVEHGVKPELDHYSCVVDLLGRAGLLEEARNLIEKMPIYPNAVIWGSLLSSCRLHGSFWIGIQAAESRLLLEPGCASTHLQLANLFASAGCWDQAARVRKLMKDKGLKPDIGHSWIEIKNEVYRFRAEDRLSNRMTEVVDIVDSLVDHMRALGNVPQGGEEEVDDVSMCNNMS